MRDPGSIPGQRESFCLLREKYYSYFIFFTASALTWYGTSSVILTHPFIVVIGDISFSLYIIHWPVVCLLQHYDMQDYRSETD